MTTAFYNGEFKNLEDIHFPADDCALMTGIGIFDSALFANNILHNAELHYGRLIYDSQKVMNIAFPYSFDEWSEIIHSLIRKNGLVIGNVRVRTQLTGGQVEKPLEQINSPNILISTAPATHPNDLPPIKALVTDKYLRIAGCSLERCKRIDYTRSYAARRLAEGHDCNEAILLNTKGDIACASTSNIFIEKEGVLLTPPLDSGCLYGTTRQSLLDSGKVQEQTLKIEDIKSAESVYLSNSITALRKIKEIVFENI